MGANDSEPTLRRIGEIAAATGLTVRTLHYYEEIGLIEPTARTEAGHRLYGPDAIEKLYRASLLRELGLPLDGVRTALGVDSTDLATVLAGHLDTVDERLAAERRVRARLIRLIDTLEPDDGTAGEPPTDASPDLIQLMEDMTMSTTTIDRRISILVYRDVEAAYDYLTRVFGFGPGELTKDPDGNVVHGEIEAGDGEFWLHPESAEFGLSSPAELGATTASMAVMVADVDAHHAHAAAEGASIRYEPVDQPYGYREYSAVDCEGHFWSFMKPLG